MKRALDLTLVGVTALLWLPTLLLVSVLIRIRMGSPVLFTQMRPGLHGKPFRLFKFRTMTDARDASGNPLPDAVRLTELGRVIRATSFDELPEIWNVLRGEMSLVGPRPLLTEYLPLYDELQARRHAVMPGITGWAQINGRNAITWEEKFALDLWYVDNQSLWLDVKILWRTLVQVVKHDGIAAPGEATAPKFTGNRR